jgi:hypothetical protein
MNILLPFFNLFNKVKKDNDGYGFTIKAKIDDESQNRIWKALSQTKMTGTGYSTW